MLLLACAGGVAAPEADPCDADGDTFPADTPRCGNQQADAGPMDCDDADAAVFPAALELCDEVDNDCSGTVDDGADADGDGAYVCADCDDLNAAVYPGAKDVCDGVDNDCSGYADEAYDVDGDGFSPCGGDCDDADPRRAAGIPEACNGYDDDCDGAVDEGFDADADGWLACRGDCDDSNAAVWLGAPEACDGVDNDCDDAADEDPSCFGCVGVHPWLVCTTAASFAVAASACRGMTGGLVEILDPHVNAALAGALSAYAPKAWIGLSDDDEEGFWLWLSGASALYTSWGAGQPDNRDGEDCATLDPAGAWADEDCDAHHAFVCG